MDKTDRLRDYGLAFLLYKQGLSVCGYELIRELFIFIKLILNSYLAQKLDINFYFCKPYHSWERGANENTNGLIRQYIPKGTDFSEVTNKRIKWIENNLNNRPRKRLGYLTPNEKFKQIINMNSVAFGT